MVVVPVALSCEITAAPESSAMASAAQPYGNILTADDLQIMATDRIVFAMANPDPEIAPAQA
jgi:malic enzyme